MIRAKSVVVLRIHQGPFNLFVRTLAVTAAPTMGVVPKARGVAVSSPLLRNRPVPVFLCVQLELGAVRLVALSPVAHKEFVVRL